MHSKVFQIRDFHIKDMFNIKIRKEQEEVLTFANYKLDYANMISRCYAPKTLINSEGKPVWIAGIQYLHNKCGEGFFLTGDGFEEAFKIAPIFFLKIMKQYMVESPFNRLQTFVKKDFTKAEKLVILMGLQKEGTLIQGGYAGEDVHLYAWVRNV